MILALIVAGQIVSAFPPLSPAEAARILAQSPGLSNRTNAPPPLPEDGPRVVIIGSSLTDGPFGPFPAYPVQRPLNCCSVYRIHVGQPTRHWRR